MTRSRPRACLALALLFATACSHPDGAPGAAAGSPSAAAPSAPKPTDVEVTGTETGLGLDEWERVREAKRTFAPHDDIQLAVFTDGTAKTTQLGVRWIGPDGQVAGATTKTFTRNGSASTAFHLQRAEGLAPGTYRAEVLLEGWLAQTVEVEVR